ncbi:MAG: TlyA family RNA methyltransferase [Lachnospiraceae bacterium]|nr:TlyA family RNA methyltransferase [Lachnospiraceae bacterium]
MKKVRLDVYLVENGFFSTRQKSQVAILEGKVFVNNLKEDKPGTLIKEDAKVEYRGEKLKYVSRGGLKLEKAVQVFNIYLSDKVCIDIGSSTGGFTDLMLQNGAKKVYAVDCGTNQLDYKLRTDDRVVVMENTNARYLSKNDLSDNKIDFISVDVSFISLTKIIPVIKEVLDDKGDAVLLIKPQFEAGRELVEKKGVVRDETTQEKVVRTIIDSCLKDDFIIRGIDFSPIKGPAGNIEYLLYISKNKNDEGMNIENIDNYIKKLVKMSHDELDKED